MNPVLLMIAGMTLIPAGDALARAAVETGLAPGAVAFSRFLIGAVLVVPLLFLRGALGLGRRFCMAQIVRGGLLAVGIFCIVTAVSRAPLAQVYGAFFVAPLVAAVIAVVALGERARPRLWAALIVGFGGVLIVLQPWSGGLGAGLAWALAAGIAYGSFLAATRALSHLGSPLSALAGQLVVGTLVLAPFGAVGLLDATPSSVVPLVLSGLASAVANFLAIAALSRAPATRLAPLVYVQLPAAVLIGGFAYGEWPGAGAALGLMMILAAGLAASLPSRTRQ